MLRGIEFYAFHGLYREEQMIGRRFIVDIEVSFQPEQDVAEQLERTVNYTELYRIAKEEMDKPCKLIETVGENIIRKVKIAFPFAKEVCVRVHKLNPPVDGFAAESVSEITG